MTPKQLARYIDHRDKRKQLQKERATIFNGTTILILLFLSLCFILSLIQR